MADGAVAALRLLGGLGAPGASESLADGDANGDPVGDAVGDALSDADGVALAVLLAVGDIEVDGVGLGETEVEGVGLGAGRAGTPGVTDVRCSQSWPNAEQARVCPVASSTTVTVAIASRNTPSDSRAIRPHR